MSLQVTVTGNVLVLELLSASSRVTTEIFHIDPGVTDPNAALLAAIHEYAVTPEGPIHDVEPHITFNWKKALKDVPGEVWERHGLHHVSAPQRLTYGAHDCPLTPAFFQHRHELGYLE